MPNDQSLSDNGSVLLSSKIVEFDFDAERSYASTQASGSKKLTSSSGLWNEIEQCQIVSYAILEKYDGFMR